LWKLPYFNAHVTMEQFGDENSAFSPK